MREEHNTPFAALTTFKVGGVAERVLYPETHDEAIAAIAAAEENRTPYMILGGGSNTLASDEAYRGTVIIPAFRTVRYEEVGNSVVHAHVDAGLGWDEFVRGAVQRGLWGVENLSGIPGSLGGGVVQNIGAYGAVLSDVFVSCAVYDIETGEEKTITARDARFGYRTSVFKESPGRFLILSATFALSKDGAPNLSYRDVNESLGHGGSVSLADVRAAVLGIRAKKFPDMRRYGTAGSFFLNPVVSKEEAEAFQARYPAMPLFPMPEGGVKVPLAWILDHVLHVKGMREGGAFVWEAQALVLATEHGARASDVRKLAQNIRARAKEKLSLNIAFEVSVIDA